MDKYTVQAIGSCNSDIARDKPNQFQDCSDVVHITVFFDGTGNNREDDNPSKSWSNIGRIFDAAINTPSKGIYSIYVSGVGTKYNGTAGDWITSSKVWMQDNFLGMGFGGGGGVRLGYSDDAVSARLKQVLIENARKLGRETSKYASEANDKSFNEISRALAKHRLIKKINISCFGFSRGAALARAFSNRIIDKCEKQANNLIYQSYPLEMKFLGLFDTVASFGVPAQNVRLPFEKRELIVSPLVSRCVHYVAAHELRYSFPVDLIRKNGKLAGEWVEEVYPGVHSDVGGGYDPASQGVSNNYSRIPMRDMMRESLSSGVRLLSYDELKKTRTALFKERFECTDETAFSYMQYLSSCGKISGTVEDKIKRHLEVYYSANGTMSRRGIEGPGQRQRQAAIYKYIGPKGMAWEIGKYRLAVKVGKMVRIGGDSSNGFAQYVKPLDWQIEAWDRTASDGAITFVSHFIHDSKVDFIGNVEPSSYFKPRGVQESTESVWTEWGNWIGDKASDAAQVTTQTYQAGVEKVEKAVDASTQAARDAAAAAQQKAKEAAVFAQQKASEAARYARQKAEEATTAARRAYDSTARAASKVAVEAQQRAKDAAQFASDKAQAAGNAVGHAYDATNKAGHSAANAGRKKMDEIEEGAERLYDNGMSWIRRTVKRVGL